MKETNREDVIRLVKSLKISAMYVEHSNVGIYLALNKEVEVLQWAASLTDEEVHVEPISFSENSGQIEEDL